MAATITTWASPAATAGWPHAPATQTVTTPGGTPVVTSFGYDGAGNTVSRVSGSVLAGTATGTVESVYEAENHLTSASNSNGGGSSVYAYDADGDRIAAAVAGTETVYLPGGTHLLPSAGFPPG